MVISQLRLQLLTCHIDTAFYRSDRQMHFIGNFLIFITGKIKWKRHTIFFWKTIDRFIYLVSISFGTSVRESGAFIPAESHYRLFLYDACHVFQYFDYLVDQLPDQYLKGRQYPYLFPLYVFASGICLGGVHLFLVVPVATLAVSFLDSGRNELFRPVLREPLFRDLTG